MKLIVTSATMDAQKFADFFGNVPTFQVSFLTQVYYKALSSVEALLHSASFRATCIATPLRDKLYEILPNVIYTEQLKTLRQVAETVAESRKWFYFLQRFQLTFRHALRDILHEKLHGVTAS